MISAQQNRKARKVCAFFFVLLLPVSTLAEPPALPAFVIEYLSANELQYKIPQGQFDERVLQALDSRSDAEPWSMVADVNGDGVNDWAGLLRNHDGQISVMAVYSMTNAYLHTELAVLGPDNDHMENYLELQPPGKVYGFSLNAEVADPELDLVNPAVHLFYFGKASVLYYWVDGSFQTFVTGD